MEWTEVFGGVPGSLDSVYDDDMIEYTLCHVPLIWSAKCRSWDHDYDIKTTNMIAVRMLSNGLHVTTSWGNGFMTLLIFAFGFLYGLFWRSGVPSRLRIALDFSSFPYLKNTGFLGFLWVYYVMGLLW